MRKTRIAVFLSSLCTLCLCGEFPGAEPKKAVKVTYDEHVKPLLVDKCFACHNPDKKSGGLVLNSYTRLMEGSSSGVIAKPGDPDGSPLYQVVAHKAEPFMPPKSPKVPDDFAMTLHRWIAGGCLENSGSKTTLVNKPKIDIGLASIAKGKPAGPPRMPTKPLPLEPVVKTTKANAITAIASSPWAPLVAVAGQKQVLLYNIDNLDLIGVLPFPEGVAHVLKFSRNGSLLLAGGGRGGHSGRVVVWNVLTGERIFTVGEETDVVLAADISPDQTQIALGGPGKMLRIYSTKDGKALFEIKKHTDWITALEFSPDGVLLATGDRNGGMYVWEAFTGREYFSLRSHAGYVTEMSWRGDSNVLATASKDSGIHLYEMENGNMVRDWSGTSAGGAMAVCYGKDGRLLSASGDRALRLWDGNGTLQRAFAPFADTPLRVALSHDGNRVVGGDWAGHVLVWDAKDSKLLGTLSANPPSVAQQFERVTKELAAKKIASEQAAAAAAAAQLAVQKAAADLAAAQKAVGESATAAKAAVDAVPRAKAGADAARSALSAAQNDVKARAERAQALAVVAAKAKAAADQAKTDAKLATAAAQASQVAAQAAAEVAAAQKLFAERTAAVQSADKARVAAQQAVAPAQAAAQAAPKRVAAAQVALKNAAARATTDQVAAASAAAAHTQATAIVAKWKAAAQSANRVSKTDGK